MEMADEKKGINFTVGIQVGISEGLAKIFERVADSISNYRKIMGDELDRVVTASFFETVRFSKHKL